MPALALVVAQIVLAASATIDVSDVNPEVGEPIEFSATVTDEDVGDTHSFEWSWRRDDLQWPQSPPLRHAGRQDGDGHRDGRRERGGHGHSVPSRERPADGGLLHSPANPGIGQTIMFTSTASDPEGPVSRAWDLDNNGDFDNGTDPSEQWSFDSGGSKTVRLRVTDGTGARTVITHSVPVRTAPSASFTIVGTSPVAPAVPDVNEPVRFTSTSTDPDGDTSSGRDIDWDLDNDGAYDDGSGTTIERRIRRPVSGRSGCVADPSGATAETGRQFRVNASDSRTQHLEYRGGTGSAAHGSAGRPGVHFHVRRCGCDSGSRAGARLRGDGRFGGHAGVVRSRGPGAGRVGSRQ